MTAESAKPSAARRVALTVLGVVGLLLLARWWGVELPSALPVTFTFRADLHPETRAWVDGYLDPFGPPPPDDGGRRDDVRPAARGRIAQIADRASRAAREVRSRDARAEAAALAAAFRRAGEGVDADGPEAAERAFRSVGGFVGRPIDGRAWADFQSVVTRDVSDAISARLIDRRGEIRLLLDSLAQGLERVR
ncbi:MAG: hypothetical protein AAF532_03600 [Planctomycetota bacterium]